MKPTRDHVAYRLGNCDVGTVRRMEAPLRCEQPHDLANEERVPFRLVVNRGDELVACRLSRDQLDETAYVTPMEA